MLLLDVSFVVKFEFVIVRFESASSVNSVNDSNLSVYPNIGQ